MLITLFSSSSTVPLALLNINSIIVEVLNKQYPGIFEVLATDPTTTVHLHWLVIAGAISFMGNTLQLLPVDNSAGSKMSLAVLGLENFTILSVLAGFFKFVYLLPVLFSDLGSMALDKNRVLVDYLLSSQLSTSQDTQQARDNLSDVSEGRKIIFTGLAALLVISLVPYGKISLTFDGALTLLLKFLGGDDSIHTTLF